MVRRFSWRGAAAGGAAGVALAWALVSGWLTGGVPVIAGALWERSVRLMPMQVFGFLIVRFKFAAKPAGFWGIMGMVILLCAAAGGLWAARRPHRLVVTALIAAVALAALLAVITMGPATMLLAARLGAEGIENADAQALRTVALAIAGNATLAAAVFAAGLGLVGRGNR